MSSSKKYWYTVSALLGILIIIGIYGAIRKKNSSTINPSSVLTLEVTGSLPEFNLIESSFLDPDDQPPSFQDIIRLLNEAKSDDRISLVILDISLLQATPSKIFELHDAIIDYRKSGKPIWGFLSYYITDFDYLVASSCSKIICEPFSFLELNGLETRLLYYKKTLESIGVDAEVVSIGKYKSATEPFTSSSPSPQDIEQRSILLDSFFDNYVKNICRNRDLSSSAYFDIINNIGFLGDDLAKQKNLLDTALSFDDLKDFAKKTLGIESKSDKNFITASSYSDQYSEQTPYKVAVINIMGNIKTGVSDMISTGDESITEALEEARKDPDVTCIILRVDSPGGSIVPSEKIRVALNKAKELKPIIISMSGLAASGGYWISAIGDRIIAHPHTITGSIGIFSIKPNFSGLAKKMKVSQTTLKRGNVSDDFSALQPYSPKARKAVYQALKHDYDRFISIVAKGRGKKVNEVENIAEGRVWLGKDALKKGLVDGLGGFLDAINLAKELSQQNDISIISYPKPQTFIENVLKGRKKNIYTSLVEKVSQDALESMFSSTTGLEGFSEEFEQLKSTLIMLKSLNKTYNPQVRLPYTISVK